MIFEIHQSPSFHRLIEPSGVDSLPKIQHLVDSPIEKTPHLRETVPNKEMEFNYIGWPLLSSCSLVNGELCFGGRSILSPHPASALCGMLIDIASSRASANLFAGYNGLLQADEALNEWLEVAVLYISPASERRCLELFNLPTPSRKASPCQLLWCICTFNCCWHS